jgi:hypothetical protein
LIPGEGSPAGSQRLSSLFPYDIFLVHVNRDRYFFLSPLSVCSLPLFLPLSSYKVINPMGLGPNSMISFKCNYILFPYFLISKGNHIEFYGFKTWISHDIIHPPHTQWNVLRYVKQPQEIDRYFHSGRFQPTIVNIDWKSRY